MSSTRAGLLLILAAAAVLAVLIQCGGSSSPSAPPHVPPTTAPTPTPTPTPGSALPPGMICDPTPPPLYGMKVGVLTGGGGENRSVLDSKPVVFNVDDYCARTGQAGGARFCDTRPEGNSQRTACDYMATGKATDTGRWGPTWTLDGKLCDGANFANCANHSGNQFLLAAKEKGRYEACAAADVPLGADGSRCGVFELR